MELAQVVPWGRNQDEYIKMFALSHADRSKRILGCGDGPASFNAEWTAQGGQVISADPVYQFSGQQLKQQIHHVAPIILKQVRSHRADFIWGSIAGPEQLLQQRMQAMQLFLDDYETGLEQGRYLNAALPILPFTDGHFDLALCSHYLFLYSDLLDKSFHLEAIAELCRVADEVRIYPLVTLSNQHSPYLESVQRYFAAQGYCVQIKAVEYQFQRGAVAMMVLKRL